MSNLDDLAALQRDQAKPAVPLTSLVDGWMVYHANKKFGPHTKAELASMLSSGMIDSTAQVWTEGWQAWKPIGSVIRPAAAPNPVECATPMAAQARIALQRTGGWIGRYRRRVGHRSFIFQIWLLAYTAVYVLWILSLLMEAASHGPAAPWRAINS